MRLIDEVIVLLLRPQLKTDIFVRAEVKVRPAGFYVWCFNRTLSIYHALKKNETNKRSTRGKKSVAIFKKKEKKIVFGI